MSPSSRFSSPVSGFDPSELLGRLRKLFLACLLLAALLHLGLVAVDPFKEQAAKAPKPLTTKFIKREPRLTKPLELRKIPQPKRKMVKREVKLAAARMDQVEATAAFNTGAVIGQVANPRVALSRASTFSTANLEPRTIVPEMLAGSRAPENKIDMALEMMDVKSMDTGRYRAMVVQDPKDRQNVTGFVRFAHVQSARSIEFGRGGISSFFIDEVRDALNEYTGIEAKYEGYITYDDSRLMEIPIIFSAGGANESELEMICRYMQAGGFVFGGANFKSLEKYGGMVSGRDFWAERLQDDHPVFSAFFDIRGGAPSSYQGGQLASGKQGVNPWNRTTGYFVKGRLSGISFSWGTGLGNRREKEAGRNRQLVVNVIIYALTQEGSMTQRLMQMVN